MYKIDRSEDGGSNNRKLGQTLFRIVFFLKYLTKKETYLQFQGTMDLRNKTE